MKLYNVKDVKGLFEVVENCEGRVEMVLPTKRINLNNSELKELIPQIVAQDGIREIEIVSDNSKDIFRLVHFAMRGEEAKAIRKEIFNDRRLLAKTA